MPKVSRVLAPSWFHRKDEDGDHFAVVLDLQEDQGGRPSGGCVIGRRPHSDPEFPGFWLQGWGFKPRNLFPTGAARLDLLSDPNSGWSPCAPSALPPDSLSELAGFAAEWVKDKNLRRAGSKALLHVQDGRILVFEAGTDAACLSAHEKIEVLMDLEDEADAEIQSVAPTLASAFRQSSTSSAWSAFS